MSRAAKGRTIPLMSLTVTVTVPPAWPEGELRRWHETKGHRLRDLVDCAVEELRDADVRIAIVEN